MDPDTSIAQDDVKSYPKVGREKAKSCLVWRVVYRDGITNGVQPGGVQPVVMMPNFINHLHLAMAAHPLLLLH